MKKKANKTLKMVAGKIFACVATIPRERTEYWTVVYIGNYLLSAESCRIVTRCKTLVY